MSDERFPSQEPNASVDKEKDAKNIISDENQENSSNLPSADIIDISDAINKSWQKKLIRSGKSGPPKGLLANALIPLRHAKEFKGVFAYNAFSHTLEIHKAPPWISEEDRKLSWERRAFSDYDEGRLAEWLQRAGIEVQNRVASNAAFLIAWDHSYHPVRDYLTKLPKWDGTKRIETWLTTYLGAADCEYVRAIGPRYLISGIARIMKPGPDCKADCVLILEGETGLQKSTALKTLSCGWFLDDLRQFGSKDAAMKISGRWIIELAELTGMNEATAEACKAFFGQTMDSFRPPYGRHVIDAPRQCIFAASTNKNVFLRDETGDRRYWPVTCEKVDIAGLERDRNKLWAEALAMFNQGHPWWLETPELRLLAAEEQHMRFDTDPWEPRIRSWLEEKNEITPEEVLLDMFNYEIEDVTKAMRNRVSAILRHLRWKRIKSRKGATRDEYYWVREGSIITE